MYAVLLFNFHGLDFSLLFSKISCDIIPCGWLGSKHQLTNWLNNCLVKCNECSSTWCACNWWVCNCLLVHFDVNIITQFIIIYMHAVILIVHCYCLAVLTVSSRFAHISNLSLSSRFAHISNLSCDWCVATPLCLELRLYWDRHNINEIYYY